MRDQIEKIKAALIDSRVLFAIDYEGVDDGGKRCCVIYFRPDVDATVVEAAMEKA